MIFFFFFFFNDTATTEIYTLSLHDALPISAISLLLAVVCRRMPPHWGRHNTYVMAGLDPAIYGLCCTAWRFTDARLKAGHDDRGTSRARGVRPPVADKPRRRHRRSSALPAP